jgi:hypothetical protein
MYRGGRYSYGGWLKSEVCGICRQNLKFEIIATIIATCTVIMSTADVHCTTLPRQSYEVSLAISIEIGSTII